MIILYLNLIMLLYYKDGSEDLVAISHTSEHLKCHLSP